MRRVGGGKRLICATRRAGLRQHRADRRRQGGEASCSSAGSSDRSDAHSAPKATSVPDASEANSCLQPSDHIFSENVSLAAADEEEYFEISEEEFERLFKSGQLFPVPQGVGSAASVFPSWRPTEAYEVSDVQLAQLLDAGTASPAPMSSVPAALAAGSPVNSARLLRGMRSAEEASCFDMAPVADAAIRSSPTSSPLASATSSRPGSAMHLVELGGKALFLPMLPRGGAELLSAEQLSARAAEQVAAATPPLTAGSSPTSSASGAAATHSSDTCAAHTGSGGHNSSNAVGSFGGGSRRHSGNRSSRGRSKEFPPCAAFSIAASAPTSAPSVASLSPDDEVVEEEPFEQQSEGHTPVSTPSSSSCNGGRLPHPPASMPPQRPPPQRERRRLSGTSPAGVVAVKSSTPSGGGLFILPTDNVPPPKRGATPTSGATSMAEEPDELDEEAYLQKQSQGSAGHAAGSPVNSTRLLRGLMGSPPVSTQEQRFEVFSPSSGSRSASVPPGGCAGACGSTNSTPEPPQELVSKNALPRRRDLHLKRGTPTGGKLPRLGSAGASGSSGASSSSSSSPMLSGAEPCGLVTASAKARGKLAPLPY